MPSAGAFAMVARISAFVTSIADLGGDVAGRPPACSDASETTSATVALVMTNSFAPSIFTEVVPREALAPARSSIAVDKAAAAGQRSRPDAQTDTTALAAIQPRAPAMVRGRLPR